MAPTSGVRQVFQTSRSHTKTLRRQGYIQQVPYRGPKNIRRRSEKFGGPGFVHPWPSTALPMYQVSCIKDNIGWLGQKTP